VSTAYQYRFRFMRGDVMIYQDSGYLTEDHARSAADVYLDWRSQYSTNEGITVEIDRRTIIIEPEWEPIT
jgi:hypothetical protein